MTAISPPIQTVLDLFSSRLPDVRFGDVDAESLARCAADVTAAADVVGAAQATLETARVALHERQETLLHQVQRALAYARVYAEADEGLSAQLEAVSLPRPARRARPDMNGNANANANALTSGGNDALVLTSEPQAARRPRGRPRKVAAVAAAVPAAIGSSPFPSPALALAELSQIVEPEEAALEELSATGE